MRRIILPLVVLSVAATGCATKKYVSHEVGEVNQKVDNLSGEVEKTQQRVKATETRLDSVDKQSQTGIAEAKTSAGAAMNKAVEAERAAKGKLLYTVTLSNDKVTFPLNRAEVSDDARKVLDDALTPIVAANQGVFFEIEGHTDGTGEPTYNEKLGDERAQAVRSYLHDQLKVALSRIEVISYGEEKPVADNKTKDGRAMNRRVVVKVLE